MAFPIRTLKDWRIKMSDWTIKEAPNTFNAWEQVSSLWVNNQSNNTNIYNTNISWVNKQQAPKITFSWSLKKQMDNDMNQQNTTQQPTINLQWATQQNNEIPELIKSARNDIINWMPMKEFDKYYPELVNTDKTVFEDFATDIWKNAPVYELSKLYPELFTEKDQEYFKQFQEENTQEQEKWLLDKIMYEPYDTSEYNPNKSFSQNLLEWEAKYASNVAWWLYNIIPWIAKMWVWVIKWTVEDMKQHFWNTLWLISDKDFKEYSEEQNKKTDALIWWLAQHYANTYWSIEWFKKQLTKDPITVIWDVLTVIWVWAAWKAKLSNIQKAKQGEILKDIMIKVNKSSSSSEIEQLMADWVKEYKKYLKAEKSWNVFWEIRKQAIKYDPYVAVPKATVKWLVWWYKIWKVIWEKSKEWFSKTKEWVWNYYDDVVSWLSKTEKTWLQANPYQSEEFNNMITKSESSQWIDDIKNYKSERFWEITDELTQKIEKIKKEKWEDWKMYNEIKKLDTKIKTENIINLFLKTFKKYWIWIDEKTWKLINIPWSKWWTLNSWDITKIQQLFGNIIADDKLNWWWLSVKQWLKNRSDASSFSNYEKQTSSNEWLNIMRELRSNIDKVLKNEIPWLKELDLLFSDKIEELWNALQDIIYKQWDVKWDFRSNIVSIISNLDKPNRALLLSRLEEVIPWIWKRIEAVNNLWKLYNKVNDIWKINKFSKTAWAITWSTALNWIPIIWPIIWWIVWYIWGWILERVISKKTANSIKNIVWKISKEWIIELEKIEKKIKNKEKLSIKEKKAIKNVIKQIEEQIRKDKIAKEKLIEKRKKEKEKKEKELRERKRLSKWKIITPWTEKQAQKIREKEIIKESKKGLPKENKTDREKLVENRKNKETPVKKENKEEKKKKIK